MPFVVVLLYSYPSHFTYIIRLVHFHHHIHLPSTSVQVQVSSNTFLHFHHTITHFHTSLGFSTRFLISINICIHRLLPSQSWVFSTVYHLLPFKSLFSPSDPPFPSPSANTTPPTLTFLSQKQYINIKELLALSRRLKELWLFGPLGVDDPTAQERNEQARQDAVRVAELLNELESNQMRDVAQRFGGTWEAMGGGSAGAGVGAIPIANANAGTGAAANGEAGQQVPQPQ